jgi:radical SAM superfamily enzyme YgiQ (UPF0313 family)
MYDPNSNERVDHYLLPLGLAYISSVLKNAGKTVDVLNMNNRDGFVKDILRSEMETNKYSIVFLGGLSLFYPNIRDIINYIREISLSSKIVVGGGIISAQPEIMFGLLKPDYGVIGEGEETVLELTEYLETGRNPALVNGLIFTDPLGKTIITPPRNAIMDLDALPFPDYESFGYSEYLNHISPIDYIAYDVVDEPRYYPVLASRSCPFNCTFCFHPLGQKYRQRSVDNIMTELKQNVEKYKINIVFIYDELFSHDKDRMIEFCTKFKAYSDTLPYKLWFYCNNRVDSTTDEMLKIMKESGAYLLSFGLESYSQRILTSMKKHTTPEQINKILHLMRENELGLQGSFILGDVAETCDTVKETIDFIKENRLLIGAGVSSTFIIPFQGTPIYKQCVKEGKIKNEIKFITEREKEGYKFFLPMNMTNIPDKDFKKLKEVVFRLHLVSDTYAVPENERTIRPGITYTDIKCPSCKKVSTIKNVPTPKGFTIRNVGCRYCFYRFHMVSKWYPLSRIIIKAFGFRRVYWLNKIKDTIVRSVQT